MLTAKSRGRVCLITKEKLLKPPAMLSFSTILCLSYAFLFVCALFIKELKSMAGGGSGSCEAVRMVVLLVG